MGSVGGGDEDNGLWSFALAFVIMKRRIGEGRFPYACPRPFAALRDGWLHTGDMEHIDERGEVYLSGRRGRYEEEMKHEKLGMRKRER